jgi:hypothetical protein
MNFDLISSQIQQKQAVSPELKIDKFGIGGMNKEEFLMNKGILCDISRKKMELMGNRHHKLKSCVPQFN